MTATSRAPGRRPCAAAKSSLTVTSSSECGDRQAPEAQPGHVVEARLAVFRQRHDAPGHRVVEARDLEVHPVRRRGSRPGCTPGSAPSRSATDLGGAHQICEHLREALVGVVALLRDRQRIVGHARHHEGGDAAEQRPARSRPPCRAGATGRAAACGRVRSSPGQLPRCPCARRCARCPTMRPSAHADHAVGHPGDHDVVRDHDRGRAEAAVDAGNGLEHDACRSRSRARRWARRRAARPGAWRSRGRWPPAAARRPTVAPENDRCARPGPRARAPPRASSGARAISVTSATFSRAVRLGIRL